MTDRERIVSKVAHEVHRRIIYDNHTTVDDITKIAVDTTLSEIVQVWQSMVEAGKTTNDLIKEPAPDYRTAPLLYHDSGIFSQQSNLRQDFHSLWTTLFGTVESTASAHQELVHAMQGLLSPSECRELAPIIDDRLNDLGWWFRVCPNCAGQLICTPKHPDPQCRCFEEVQKRSMDDWRAMQLVPPHMVGDAEVARRVNRPNIWPM